MIKKTPRMVRNKNPIATKKDLKIVCNGLTKRLSGFEYDISALKNQNSILFINIHDLANYLSDIGLFDTKDFIDYVSERTNKRQRVRSIMNMDIPKEKKMEMCEEENIPLEWINQLMDLKEYDE